MHPHRGDNVLLKPQPPVVGPNLHTLSLKAWFNAFMVPSNAIYVARSTFQFFKSRKFLPESNSLLTQAFLYSFEMGDARTMWETYRLGKLLKDSLRNILYVPLIYLKIISSPKRKAIWTHFYHRDSWIIFLQPYEYRVNKIYHWACFVPISLRSEVIQT